MTVQRRVEPVYAPNRSRHSTDYPFIKRPQPAPRAVSDMHGESFDKVVISEEGRRWMENRKSQWAAMRTMI